MARHPDLAGPIRELIPALVELEQLGGSTGGSASARSVGRRPRRPTSRRPAAGRLLILRRIGGGGMGVVYEAEHESLKSRRGAEGDAPAVPGRPGISAAVPRRGPAGRRAAPHQHRQRLRLRRAGRRLLLRHAVHPGPAAGPASWPISIASARSRPGRAVPRADRRPAGRPGAPSGAGLFTRPVRCRAGRPRPAEVDGGRRRPATARRPGDRRALARGEPDALPARSRGGERREPSAGVEPSPLGSTSLGGSGEIRYFREVARVGARSPTRWSTPTAAASCTATSSRRTCCSTPWATSGSPTSAWRSWRRRTT